MTTAAQAYTAIRSRLEANVPTDANSLPVHLRWQNGNEGAVPDLPAPFVYVEFDNDGSPTRGPAGYGGGVGNNLWRNEASIVAYAMADRGHGVDEALSIAEQIATLFRSHRDSDISCFRATAYPGGDGADLKPPGLESVVGNYFYAVAEIDLHFDQLG